MEVEVALLAADELASAAASLALSSRTGTGGTGSGPEEDGYGGGGGYSSPGSGTSSPGRTQRWLGRALPGSPSRCVGAAAQRQRVHACMRMCVHATANGVGVGWVEVWAGRRLRRTLQAHTQPAALPSLL